MASRIPPAARSLRRANCRLVAGVGLSDRVRYGLGRAVLLCLWAGLSGCQSETPWNVVLFTFDTTRADFLGCYGRQSASTPNLDRLANEGFLFEHAYSSNPVTQAAHSTILTGVYPMVHGVRDNTFFRLSDEQETLAELLSAAGYATAAAIGGFPLTEEFGTAQGFDVYDDDLTADRRDYRGRPEQRSRHTGYDERPAGHVNDAILPWLRATVERGRQPFFVWLHYWDPHEPHIAPPPYDQLFAHEPYSGEIAYADGSLGAMLRELEGLGQLGHTLVVMTADHGEARFEHGEMTHAFLAYDSTIRVPLILKIPGRQGGRRITERVGTVDIVPTVLDLLGLDLPGRLQGRSLEPLTRDDGDRPLRPSRREYYAESLSPRLSHGLGELRVLFRGPYKYIHGPRPELFDLEEDPGELRELSAGRPDELRQIHQGLQAFITEHASAEARSATYEASEATKRQLQALGYLSTVGEAPGAVGEILRSDGAAPQDRVQDVNLTIRLRNHLGGGDFRAAMEIAEQLVSAVPDHPFYRAKLVESLLGLGEIEKAIHVIEEADTISAANLEEYLRAASALSDAGQRERGLALARRLVEAEETASGRLLLAQLHRRAGDDDGFERDLRRALELAPEDLEARLVWSQYLIETGSLAEAERELRGILASYPALAGAHLAYGRVLAQSGQAEEAIDRLGRAVTLAPGLCEAHLERLELLVALERAESALKATAAMRRGCRDGAFLERAAEAVAEGRDG